MGFNAHLVYCLKNVLNVKALVGTFKQKEAIAEAFSVIVDTFLMVMVHLYVIWIPTYFIHGHTVEEQALCPGGGVGDEHSGGVVLQLLGEVLHVVRLGLERDQVRVQLRPLRLAQLLLSVLRTHAFSYLGQPESLLVR